LAGRLCVFNRWTAGIGQFTENVRLIAPDQTTVLRKGEMKFELRDPGSHSTNVMVFSQVEFKAAGTYFIEVLVDDVMKLRYPVPLVLAPPPNQNPQPPPTEEKKA
jgi:type IV secretory pathway TrbF-like protein